MLLGDRLLFVDDVADEFVGDGRDHYKGVEVQEEGLEGHVTDFSFLAEVLHASHIDVHSEVLDEDAETVGVFGAFIQQEVGDGGILADYPHVDFDHASGDCFEAFSAVEYLLEAWEGGAYRLLVDCFEEFLFCAEVIVEARAVDVAGFGDIVHFGGFEAFLHEDAAGFGDDLFLCEVVLHLWVPGFLHVRFTQR